MCYNIINQKKKTKKRLKQGLVASGLSQRVFLFAYIIAYLEIILKTL